VRVIEVLGSGCQKCQHVEKIVREVVDAAGIPADVRHVTDPGQIAARGVLATPGLVIDGRVVAAGRVPTREQIAAWLDIA
jgi:small redox-active disulfide protein 2